MKKVSRRAKVVKKTKSKKFLWWISFGFLAAVVGVFGFNYANMQNPSDPSDTAVLGATSPYVKMDNPTSSCDGHVYNSSTQKIYNITWYSGGTNLHSLQAQLIVGGKTVAVSGTINPVSKGHISFKMTGPYSEDVHVLIREYSTNNSSLGVHADKYFKYSPCYSFKNGWNSFQFIRG